MIPSVEECCRFMEEYGMLDNIKAHSLMVERVAHVISLGLLDAGVDLSLEKVTAGALLHDIGKTLCLGTTEDHAAEGRKICLRNDLGEIADIVGEHVRLKAYNLSGSIREKEIVYYADKRVNHDSVVSLEERLHYILKSYGKDQEPLCRRIKKNFSLCSLVEKKLFAKLSFLPAELAVRVSQSKGLFCSI